MQWSFNLQNGIIIFFLTTNLLFSYNIKARHINFTISKLNTNNTSFNLFKKIFSRNFLMFSEIIGFFSYEMELWFRNEVNIFVPDIKFTVLI